MTPAQDKARMLLELQRQARQAPVLDLPDARPDPMELPEVTVERMNPATGAFEPDLRPDAEARMRSQEARQQQTRDAAANTARQAAAQGGSAQGALARGQRAWQEGGDASADAPAAGFATLSPAAQANLRKKYENSGHTQTMPFEDWYQDNFTGSFPHEVETAAGRTVRIQGGKDPTLEPGQNSAVAQSRVAAGKPLPEGREASQYSEEQRRRMQRNVHSPEVPMTRFGGTFTHNVDGSVSSRAPNPQMLETADQIAADPEQGAGSASHTMALAMAYGIDASQYGDDMDLLKADVMREKQRHDALGKSYDVVDNGMGGFRYKFNQQKSNEAVADREAGMSDQRKLQFAKEIYARHRGLTGEDGKPFLTFEDVMNKASTPNGFAELRMLNQSANAMAGGMRAQNVRNNWANRNMTIAANNPMVAQGLYMRSLQAAAESGDPFRVAAVHSSFGNDRAARDYMSLAAQQADAAAVVAAGESAARARDQDTPADKPYAERFSEEVAAAMRNPDPVTRRTALIGILTKMEVVPPDQVEKVADALIMSASGGAVTPEQTRTWWQWLTGTPQTPAAPQQPKPLPAGVPGPALPPQQAATPGTAPPASGRGAMADAADTAIRDFFSGTGPRLPNTNHPYRRGS
jgi:hypothetical protein